MTPSSPQAPGLGANPAPVWPLLRAADGEMQLTVDSWGMLLQDGLMPQPGLATGSH